MYTFECRYLKENGVFDELGCWKVYCDAMMQDLWNWRSVDVAYFFCAWQQGHVYQCVIYGFIQQKISFNLWKGAENWTRFSRYSIASQNRFSLKIDNGREIRLRPLHTWRGIHDENNGIFFGALRGLACKRNEFPQPHRFSAMFTTDDRKVEICLQ